MYQGCDKWHANYPTRHENSKHNDCVKLYLRDNYGGPSPMENGIHEMNEVSDSKRHQEAQKLLHTVSTCVKEHMGFTKYEALCQLRKLNGLELGDNYLNRIACGRFVGYIADDLKMELKSDINNCRFVSILSNGSTDKGILEEEIIYARYVKDGVPHTQLVSVEEPSSPNAVGTMNAI